MSETLPYLSRVMRLRFVLWLNKGRFVVCFVLCALGIGVEFTTTTTGTASQFHHIGDPHTVADILAFAYVAAALLCLYVRHWWSDLVTLVPLTFYFILALLYAYATHNINAPIVYGAILSYTAYILWRE